MHSTFSLLTSPCGQYGQQRNIFVLTKIITPILFIGQHVNRVDWMFLCQGRNTAESTIWTNMISDKTGWYAMAVHRRLPDPIAFINNCSQLLWCIDVYNTQWSIDDAWNFSDAVKDRCMTFRHGKWRLWEKQATGKQDEFWMGKTLVELGLAIW